MRMVYLGSRMSGGIAEVDFNGWGLEHLEVQDPLPNGFTGFGTMV